MQNEQSGPIQSKRIETRDNVKAISYRLTGKDYTTMDYDRAWMALTEYVQKQHLLDKCGPEAEYFNMYLDDPTMGGELRCDVCIADPLVNGLESADGVDVIDVKGGRFLVYLLKGSYENSLTVFYRNMFQLVTAEHVTVRKEPMFEKYLNDPSGTAPEELLTEVWIPIQ